MNQWNANTNLDELNEFGIDEIVEEYDAEEICGKNGWINADYEEAVPSLINNTGANNNFKNGFVPTDVSNNYIRNFKYTTVEDEICLTDLAERLGNIDNIQVVNNPINAKITCNDNLISVENQGVYGLVQMKVSGHNLGEAKSARTENIFVELSQANEDDWNNTEDDYIEDDVIGLSDEELEETAGGYMKCKTIRKNCRTNSIKISGLQRGTFCHCEVFEGQRYVKVTREKKCRYVKIAKKDRYKRNKFKLRMSFIVDVNRNYSVCYFFIINFC